MKKHGAQGVRSVQALAVRGHESRYRPEDVVIEEPLEIRVAGETVTTTMRTPGDDRYLALGFLHAEGIVHSLDDAGSVFHCGRTDDPHYGHALEVTPGPGVSLDVDAVARATRLGITHSACGVCGRDSIDDLLARVPPVNAAVHIAPALLMAVPQLLAAHQTNFARTGGLHAACAVTASGNVLAHAEDVGRHNAVDKVVGKLLYARALPRTEGSSAPTLLAVSGRASFEIVQKAAVAGFACVASVSAASSLAIDAAEALGVTLASFVRDGRFTLYTHAARVMESERGGESPL